MDNIKELIKKYLPAPLAIPIGLQITILLGMLKIGDLSQLMPFSLPKPYEKIPILTIAAILVLSCLLWGSSYFVLYLKYRKKLKPKFGVLWDKNKEAYCPADETYLSDYTEYKKGKGIPSDYGFWCSKCNNVIRLTDHGQPLKLEDAKKLLDK